MAMRGRWLQPVLDTSGQLRTEAWHLLTEGDVRILVRLTDATWVGR